MPSRRMMCTRCSRTDVPHTLIPGSDLLELIAWCFLLIPGLVYCYWRHTTRRKVCAHCGGIELLRESRAASQRGADAPQPTAGGRVVYEARPLRWFATPTQRLRRLCLGATLVVVVFAGWAVYAVNQVDVVPASRSQEAQREESYKPAKEKRVESRRERECERLCSEFHRSRAHGHRECMMNCVARFDFKAEEPGAVNGCADLLDPNACDFVAGRSSGNGNPIPR
jgi:hypothetical protein